MNSLSVLFSSVCEETAILSGVVVWELDDKRCGQAEGCATVKCRLCRSINSYRFLLLRTDRLCGLVVRVIGYTSGGPGSIPVTTRKNISGSGTESTQPREYNWGATW
jgi:hypothetical protein